MEPRRKRISTNVEDIVFDIIVRQVIANRDISISDYVRSLIIKDLDNAKLLPEMAKDVLLVGIENIVLEGVA